jgi:hypothetical protein
MRAIEGAPRIPPVRRPLRHDLQQVLADMLTDENRAGGAEPRDERTALIAPGSRPRQLSKAKRR